MNNIKTKTIALVASLAALMAITRFNHFGTAVSMPDASLAIFFLGGLYLARHARASMAAFLLLIFEAGLVDYYATSVQGISDWCITPAYSFLIPAYGSLWMAGRWFALRFTMEGRKLAGLAMVAWAASSFAFILSNVAFYWFSGYFAEMNAAEFISRVAQYYGSYVSVTLLYIACAVGIQMMFGVIGRQRAHLPSDVA